MIYGPCLLVRALDHHCSTVVEVQCDRQATSDDKLKPIVDGTPDLVVATVLGVVALTDIPPCLQSVCIEQNIRDVVGGQGLWTLVEIVEVERLWVGAELGVDLFPLLPSALSVSWVGVGEVWPLGGFLLTFGPVIWLGLGSCFVTVGPAFGAHHARCCAVCWHLQMVQKRHRSRQQNK